MRRVHIVGGKNHGKTTLVEDLIRELTGRGLRVGSIKHTHHQHELDVPGKDSFRHREAGAAVVGILTRSINAVFWSNPKSAAGEELVGDDRYSQFAPAFADCQVVIVEGDTRTAAPKLEVWRAEMQTAPLAPQLVNVQALVSDDQPPSSLRVLSRRDVAALADFVLELAHAGLRL